MPDNYGTVTLVILYVCDDRQTLARQDICISGFDFKTAFEKVVFDPKIMITFLYKIKLTTYALCQNFQAELTYRKFDHLTILEFDEL